MHACCQTVRHTCPIILLRACTVHEWQGYLSHPQSWRAVAAKRTPQALVAQHWHLLARGSRPQKGRWGQAPFPAI
jgi:hypothetical protein